MKRTKLAKFLKASRLKRGLTLRDIEKKSKYKITDGHVSKIENGFINEPSPHQLRAISKTLNLNYLEVIMEAGYVTYADLKGWEKL